MPAALIKERVAKEVWDSYTKVTIVRDPWERVVSLFFWRNSKLELPSVPLDMIVQRAGYNWKLYTIDGRSEIDFVIRYETLETDLEALRDRLGLGGEVNLVQAKSGIRPPRSSARDLLTEQQAQRIAELDHNEIEMFGYRWSDTNGDATT